MLAESQLRSILNRLPTRTIHGPYSRCVAYRHLVPRPLGALPVGGPQPLWGMGSRNSGGRFTPKGSFETVYLAEDPITAFREVWLFLQHPSAPPFTVRTPPLVHVAVDAVLLSALDVTDAGVQDALGTTRQELTGDWWSIQTQGLEAPTQTLGRVCYESGRFDAIRYYSSKNPPNGVCIAVLSERLRDQAYLEVYDPYDQLAQRFP